MPRPPRFVLAGQPHHVIQRGNDRSDLFHSRNDFRRYLKVLGETSMYADCAVHAYVLMTNHVHLLVTPNHERGLGRLMQGLGSRYVWWFNTRRHRTGTRLDGRYRSTLISSQRYFFACSRYIELNPVRAGIVARPWDYPWSSFRHSAFGAADSLISSHPLYDALGETSASRQAAYRTLFQQPLDTSDLDAIRHATNSGAVLASPAGTALLEQHLQVRLTRLPRGGDRRSEHFRRRFSEASHVRPRGPRGVHADITI